MRARMLKAWCALALVALSSTAGAECVRSRHGDVLCPPPESRCLQDLHGEWWCSSSGGGIVLDRARQPVCGPGQCVADLRGDVKCSSQPRGAAALDRYREAQCSGSCVAAAQAACTRLQR